MLLTFLFSVKLSWTPRHLRLAGRTSNGRHYWALSTSRSVQKLQDLLLSKVFCKTPPSSGDAGHLCDSTVQCTWSLEVQRSCHARSPEPPGLRSSLLRCPHNHALASRGPVTPSGPEREWTSLHYSWNPEYLSVLSLNLFVSAVELILTCVKQSRILPGLFALSSCLAYAIWPCIHTFSWVRKDQDVGLFPLTRKRGENTARTKHKGNRKWGLWCVTEPDHLACATFFPVNSVEPDRSHVLGDGMEGEQWLTDPINFPCGGAWWEFPQPAGWKETWENSRASQKHFPPRLQERVNARSISGSFSGTNWRYAYFT